MAADRFPLALGVWLLTAAVCHCLPAGGGISAASAGETSVKDVFGPPQRCSLQTPFAELASMIGSFAVTDRETPQPRWRPTGPLRRLLPESTKRVRFASAASSEVDRPGFPERDADTDFKLLSFTPEQRFRFREDAHRFLPMLRDDARGVVNWNNAAILGGSLAVAIAFRQDLDAEVRANTARHPERWETGSEVLGWIGDAPVQIPALAVLYGFSVRRDDHELHDFATTLISAYTINGLSTLAVKGVANTDRPSDDWNGGQFGFPSFHSSSAFTIAAVADEYYGPKAGVPLYALAGLVGWSRIDQRDHDLSDVVFGAAIGYVIGKSVAGRHLRGDSRVRLLPYAHPTEGTSGLMVELSF